MVGGRVRKRQWLGEGPMTGWLWQPGRGTTKLYNTPTPQIGADRCMQKSLPVGTFLIVQEFAFFASVLADGWGRVRKRRCLGEGLMTGWLWQPGRGTTKLYNTPTPQIGADR